MKIIQNIAKVAIVVADYDEAIDFYTQKLNFQLIEDTQLSSTKRWVVIAPPGSTGSNLLLAKAKNQEEQSRIGNQTGGRVFLFLYTNDFWRDYNDMKAKGITFIGSPREEPYGKVVVFQDIYGNLWDFIEPSTD